MDLITRGDAYMYGFGPNFWLELFLILAIFGLLLFLFNTIMIKLLRVKRKKFFSYHHINHQHKIIDWTIRITFIFLLFIGFSFNITRDLSERLWFLEVHSLIFLFLIVSEFARAYMEWKYVENRNAYLFTLSQLAFIIFLLLLLLTTDFFGFG